MTGTLDHAYVPKLASKVRFTFDRHEQKHMLLYPERGLVLNDSATAIVRKIDGVRTLMEIADAIAIDIGMPGRDLLGDVVAFVTELRDKGLLA